MKLTKILNELKWEASALEMCMNDMVPLTLSIVKQLVETRRTTAMHITDVDNLPKLVSLEGKSKSISAFNRTSDIDMGPVTGNGMWTKGGILVLLSGIVLAESVHDLWSKPDKSGIRWVNPGNAMYDEFSKKHQIIDYAPKLKPLKAKWEKFTSSYNDIHKTEPDLTNEEKYYFIKTYIDTAYKLMITNREDFQKKYINSNYLSSRSNWNELIISKIKVEKIGVIEDSNGIGSNKKVIDSIKKKYQNVEVIKTKDIPSFMKKHGIQVVN
jgi:hypothetical protein